MATKSMGEMICELRKNKNMTQAHLAKEMSVTDKAVSKWERNLSCPDIGSLSRLAEILGVSTDELLTAKSQNKTTGNVGKIIHLIFCGVGIAMGVAVVILSILEAIETREAITLLGIGVFCLAINALDRSEEP